MNTTWSSRSINPELVKGLVDLASEERHNWDSWGNGFEWVTLMNAGQLPAAAALLAPLIAEIENGLTPEELQERLGDLYPQLDETQLADLLARAFFIADLWGRAHAKT